MTPNTPPNFNQMFAALRQKLELQTKELDRMAREMAVIKERPLSPEDEINAIPGRRLFFLPTKTQDFTATQDGAKGSAMSFTISQDGPFIMTHFPLVMWKATLPTNGTNYGRWMPIMSYPTPFQHSQVALDTTFKAFADMIDISYEMVDSGPQQNFQDNPLPPLISLPGALQPLPVPTKFAPASVITFTPTYENIFFASDPTTDTTGGRLVVSLIGYRISNRQ